MKGQDSVRTDSCDSTMTTDTVIEGADDQMPTISEYKAKRKAHLLRSESVAGPSGCLSGIYGSLDRRAKLKMMHQQMSMDETRCSFASTSTTSASPDGPRVVPKSAVDRRKRYLSRKQTCSAPDSLEDSTPFTDRLAVTYYLDSMYTNGRHSWQGTVDDRHMLSVSPEPSG
uniref:Uncharacterized protein n=1 Tax=Strigamia maritima TaxID=126957 RepID=T1JEI4_STRMM